MRRPYNTIFRATKLQNRFMDMMRTRRLDLGLSQYELAQRMHVVPATVSAWETSRRKSLSLDDAVTLTRALDLDLSETLKELGC